MKMTGSSESVNCICCNAVFRVINVISLTITLTLNLAILTVPFVYLSAQCQIRTNADESSWSLQSSAKRCLKQHGGAIWQNAIVC